VPQAEQRTPLFVKDTLIPLQQSTVKDLFRKLKVRAGIPRLRPHLLRHSFATRYLENGGDIYSLQQILGHTSFEMVKKYVHLIPSKTVSAFPSFRPWITSPKNEQTPVPHAVEVPGLSRGDPSATRTRDTLIKSQVLCQLS